MFLFFYTLEFFLNELLNSANSVTKIFVITVKGLEPATSYIRDHDTTTAPARHMYETGSLNWPQFMPKWFIRYPEFTDFNESSPFRKNSNINNTWATETGLRMVWILLDHDEKAYDQANSIKLIAIKPIVFDPKQIAIHYNITITIDTL